MKLRGLDQQRGRIWRGEKVPLLSGLRLPVVFRFTVAPAGLAPAERRIGHYRAAVLPRWAFSAAAARPGPGGGSGKREGVSRPGSSGQSFAPLGQAQRGQSKDEQKSEPSLRYGARTFHHPRSDPFSLFQQEVPARDGLTKQIEKVRGLLSR